MLSRFAVALMHLALLALVCAIAAFWAIRIFTPAPASAPPSAAPVAMREADPVLAARMFGLVQAAPARTALDVQAFGAFAAGRDSAAVLAVEGRPARVYLLNQEVARGARLVDVGKDAVTIEQGGVRRDVALPPLQLPGAGGRPPPPGFTREGNTLTAPTVASSGSAVPARPPAGRLPAVPAAQLPQPQLLQPQLPQPQLLQPQVQQPQVQQPAQTAAPAEEDESVDSSPVPGRRSGRNRNLAQ